MMLVPGPGATAVTVGSFDGVHLGHRDVLRRLAIRARTLGLRSVLVTFDPHPLEVVNPSAAPPLLTVGDEKTEALATCEIDHVVVLPFTPELAAYSAEQFVDEVLIKRVRMRELMIGHDHGFGRDRRGNAAVLRTLAAARGFGLDIIDAVGSDDRHPVFVDGHPARGGRWGSGERGASTRTALLDRGNCRAGLGAGTLTGLSHHQSRTAIPSEAAPSRRRLCRPGADAIGPVCGDDESRTSSDVR